MLYIIYTYLYYSISNIYIYIYLFYKKKYIWTDRQATGSSTRARRYMRPRRGLSQAGRAALPPIRYSSSRSRFLSLAINLDLATCPSNHFPHARWRNAPLTLNHDPALGRPTLR